MFNTIKNQISSMIMFCTFSICISANTCTKRWGMKKLFFQLLFIGAVVLANNYSARAQHCPPGPSCQPDCFQNQFTTHPPVTYDIPFAGSGCSFEITYQYRVACPNQTPGNWHDLQILGVRLIGNCAPFTFGGDVRTVYNLAVQTLLLKNPINFPPTSPPNQAGDCYDNWRVISSGCFKFNSQTGCYQPCDVSGPCCVQPYQVCLEVVNGILTRVIRSFPPASNNSSCPDEPTNGADQCVSICY